MKIWELETPALLIDQERMERNVARLADYCREHHLKLRPHTKTHKVPELARFQVQHGAWGVTVAKVGEAEVMARGGIENILIAYPVLGGSKGARVAELARTCAITVGLDSREAAQALSSAAAASGADIEVLVELDTGFHRCGVPVEDAAGVSAAVALSQAVDRLPGLRLAGVMFYPGHIWVEPALQQQMLARQDAILQQVIEEMKKSGLRCDVVSGGSTPTRFNSHLIPQLTEIRAGTYIFNDRNTVHLKAAEPGDCALSVLVTIVSTSVPGQIIVDGGSKTFSSDRHLAGPESGYGEMMSHPDLLLSGLSEEHGHISAPRGRGALGVGDRLRVLMNHACACMHLHETAWVHRGEEVVGCYQVAGRGKLQ